MLGVDYSFARPGGAAIRAAGFNFACRYLASSAGKRITVDEVTDLRDNGIDLVLVFEDDASQAIKGTAQGTADGREAGAQADAISFPKDRPLYYAVDTQVGDNYLQAIDDYLRAAEAASGRRSGIYGDYTVVQHCLASGSAGYGWQTVAWSGGKVLPNAHIYQNGQSALNGGADVDESQQADFGQWSGGNMSTIATQDIVDSLAHAYLNDDIAHNDGLKAYIGQPVEDVIVAFNGSQERGAYLKSQEDVLNIANIRGSRLDQVAKSLGIASGDSFDAILAKIAGLEKPTVITPAVTGASGTATYSITSNLNQPPPHRDNWLIAFLKKLGL